MILLVLGLALWWAVHLFKVLQPGRRRALGAEIGEGAAKGGAALLLILSVVLMTVGYQNAPFVPLWYPPAWTVHLNNLLMVLAVGIFIAGTFKGHVRTWIRHPQLTGFKLWAVAHLLVNGDLWATVLFGGLLGWAVVSLVGINKRDGKGPKPSETTMLGNGLHLVVTLAVFVAVAGVHNYLGYWPFAGSPPGS